MYVAHLFICRREKAALEEARSKLDKEIAVFAEARIPTNVGQIDMAGTADELIGPDQADTDKKALPAEHALPLQRYNELLALCVSELN